MTSTGKIARLPKHIRDQLNQRLEDGQTAEDILPWLNRLPECKKMLAEKFGSRPITPQNLSQWKNGGYQTWLRVQQACEQARLLSEQDDAFIAKDGLTIADRLGVLVAAQLLADFQTLDNIPDADQRWKRFQNIVRELSRLRREDNHGRRVRLAEGQWSEKRRRQAEQDEKNRKEAEKGRLIGWAWSLFTKKESIESHGGGEMGRRWADWFHRVENELPMPKWWPGPWADTDFGPDGTDWSKVSLPNKPKGSSHIASKCSESGSSSIKSNPIKVNPSKSKAVEPPIFTASGPVKANQSKSNQPPANVPDAGAAPRLAAPERSEGGNTEHETRNSPALDPASRRSATATDPPSTTPDLPP